MKYWKPILMISTVITAFVVLIFVVIPLEEDFHIDKVNEFKKEKTLLLRYNQFLDGELEKLEVQTDSLLGLAARDKITIIKLKLALNEKLDTIAQYDDVQLYGFFARFKTDSTTD